ncbi:membrane associated rhomboid family serine protease [Bacilli bacterium PM5-3]|nr:membrane associated rhomboid family serine protease [Bacilli bacterium PM5-3]MDH6603315.1 membrane associated rhomboid family serine protease [Bacilli bacterium PM5-9]
MIKMKDNKFTILILINVVVYFAAQIFIGQSEYDIYYWFGIQKNLFLDGHEFYRLFTYSFAHGDIVHLIMNMIALYYISDPVIRFTDEKFSFIIYAIAALVSGLGIVFFSSEITVGSSGAIYGLFGVIIYYAIKQYRHGYNEMVVSLLPVIIINIIISFAPDVSLTGHLFGLLAGLIGAFIYDKRKRQQYW